MLKKLQNLFLATIEKIEGNPTPLKRYFLLFIAILALRLTLEFFSSNRLFTLADIAHIGLWFVFIVLAFLIQLQVFSKEKMERVVKLVIVSFTIALSAPVIDLLISGGQGAKMNYLSVNSWSDFWWNYFTAGGTSITRGATLGIRIEIALLVIAAFNYIRLKSKSYLRAFVGTISIYSVLVLSGIVPMAMNFIVNFLNLSYTEGDNSTILMLLSLNTRLLFIAFYRHSPKRITSLIANIPWLGFALAIIPFLIGLGLARTTFPAQWSLNPTRTFYFLLFPMLGFCFAVLAGLQLKTFQEKINRQKDLAVKNGLLLLIPIISFSISEFTFFIALLIWGLLFLTFEAPLKLFKLPGLRNLFIGMGCCSAALFGFTALGGPMIGFPKDWLLTIFILGFGISLIGEFSKSRNLAPSPYQLWISQKPKVFLWSFAIMLLLLPLSGIVLLKKGAPQLILVMLSTFPAVIHLLTRKNESALTYVLFGAPLAIFLYLAWI